MSLVLECSESGAGVFRNERNMQGTRMEVRLSVGGEVGCGSGKPYRDAEPREAWEPGTCQRDDHRRCVIHAYPQIEVIRAIILEGGPHLLHEL